MHACCARAWFKPFGPLASCACHLESIVPASFCRSDLEYEMDRFSDELAEINAKYTYMERPSGSLQQQVPGAGSGERGVWADRRCVHQKRALSQHDWKGSCVCLPAPLQPPLTNPDTMKLKSLLSGFSRAAHIFL
jgi:hypothetical protein